MTKGLKMSVSMTEAKLLEGKSLAVKIQEDILLKVKELKLTGHTLPRLVALQCGKNPVDRDA